MANITVKNISKNFRIGYKKHLTILQRIISFSSGREPKKNIKVLDGVSYEFKPGEITGIIGKNGSGKSTLLRTIAGIYKGNSGEIIANGKIISLINLVVGFKGRLSMKDNIFLCCSLFGLGRRDIKKKFNLIVEFSGLEKFVETKLYQFSAGMLQRLAFSIAINCNPQILLLDEVFEVGDEDFRIKSVEKIKSFAKQGGCVVFVSHELFIMEKYCNKIIWLDNGKIKRTGNPKEVIEIYNKY